MIKKYILIIAGLVSVLCSFAQTNPAVQTLPFTLVAGSGTTLPAGVAVHKFATLPITRTLLPGNADLPNTATSGAGGWKDEVSSGISILSSGSQAAGAWIISINTSGKTNIQVQWTVRLMLQQASRDNSVALQYRVGTTGNFTDVGTTSTYSSTGQAVNHSQSFAELLPAAAENQPEVQVRWIYWESAGSAGSRDRLAVDDITIAETSPPCTQPIAQPSSINLTPAVNSISGSFIAAVPVADGYIVLRSTSVSLTVLPADGTSYTIGQALGNAFVVESGATVLFTDNGLIANTQYFYFVFAFNNISCSAGPNYLTVNPLTGTSTTLPLAGCTTPVLPPTGLSLTVGGSYIVGSFVTEPTANNYLVVYSSNSSLSFTPVNGTIYTSGQIIGPDKIVSYTTSNTFFITGLNNSTIYYVFVFSANGTCNGEPFYNTTSLNGNATTTTGGPPAGYYNGATGLTCQNLKTALSNIITTGQISLSYSTIDDIQMPIVDTIRSDNGLSSIIWDIYSNNPTGPEPFTFTSAQNPNGGFCVGGATPGVEGVCWNKEHTFPRSWFKLSGSSYQQPTEADLFVVRPTDSKINSNRGNIPYSTTGSSTYQFPIPGAFPVYPMPPNPVLDKIGPSNFPGVTAAASFEPYNAFKGDLARGYFYVLTRYQSNISNWVSLNGATGLSIVADGATNGGLYPSFQLSYLTMMYNWHNLDPVDAKEINRNDLIFTQQNNRNPYIDHPEYVALVWQCTGALPITIIDFTAQKNNESVLLKWYATFETNFKLFEIERSVNGTDFYKAGEVIGRNLANYTFTDNNLPDGNVIYYRLKMIDIDGRYTYSKTVLVHNNNNFSNALVYPNPTKGGLTIKLQKGLSQSSQLQVDDITGRVVCQLTLAKGQNNIDLDVSKLPVGNYLIKIVNSNELINQSFVIIK